MRNGLVATLFSLLTVGVLGQNQAYKANMSVSFGAKQYIGEYGTEFLDFSSLHAAAGFSYGRYINPSFDWRFSFSHGQIDYINGDSSSAIPVGEGFKNRITNFEFGFKYKLANGYLLPADFIISPYAYAGIGDAFMSAEHYVYGNDFAFNFPMGGGVDIRFNDRWNLSLSSIFYFSLSDDLDGYDRIGQNDNLRDRFIFNSIGLGYSYMPRLDTDGDGIMDDKDKCPKIPGSQATGGCPDADNDGVVDDKDKCPNTSGDDGFGCPKIKANTIKVMEDAMNGLQFENGSSKIREASYAKLDKVYEIMKANPMFVLDINGHTDNVGETQFNLKLSKDRANAAKAYLVKKGLKEERIHANGYGDTKPIASNETEEGRAKNRRVEFKVHY